MGKTDRSRSIPNRSGVSRNVAGNSSASLGRTVKQSVNATILDPTGLDATKAAVGRFAQNEARNIKERGLSRPARRGNAGIISTADEFTATMGVFAGVIYGIEVTNIPGSVPTPSTWRGLEFRGLYGVTTNDDVTIQFGPTNSPVQVPGVDAIRVRSDDGGGVDETIQWNAGADVYREINSPLTAWFVSRNGLFTTFTLEEA